MAIRNSMKTETLIPLIDHPIIKLDICFWSTWFVFYFPFVIYVCRSFSYFCKGLWVPLRFWSTYIQLTPEILQTYCIKRAGDLNSSGTPDTTFSSWARFVCLSFVFHLVFCQCFAISVFVIILFHSVCFHCITMSSVCRIWTRSMPISPYW